MPFCFRTKPQCLGCRVVNACESFARHRTMSLDHFAGNHKFLYALLRWQSIHRVKEQLFQEAAEAPNFNSFQMHSSFGDHVAMPGRILLSTRTPPSVREELALEALADAGVAVAVYPLERDELPRWIAGRLARQDQRADNRARAVD